MPRFVFFQCLSMLFIWLTAAAAFAFERSDGVTVRCQFEREGLRHTVEEVWLGQAEAGNRHPELGGAVAVVRQGADGWPVIFFDRAVFQQTQAKSAFITDFIFYHECGHAREQQIDEIAANCYALVSLQTLGMMDENKLALLAAHHQSMSRLPARYGGNGSVFWQRTLDCARQKTQASLAH